MCTMFCKSQLGDVLPPGMGRRGGPSVWPGAGGSVMGPCLWACAHCQGICLPSQSCPPYLTSSYLIFSQCLACFSWECLLLGMRENSSQFNVMASAWPYCTIKGHPCLILMSRWPLFLGQKQSSQVTPPSPEWTWAGPSPFVASSHNTNWVHFPCPVKFSPAVLSAAWMEAPESRSHFWVQSGGALMKVLTHLCTVACYRAPL